MAERFALGDYDRFDHFIAASVWDAAPETELLVQADKLVGGRDAVSAYYTAMPRRVRPRSALLRNTRRRLARLPIAKRWCHRRSRAAKCR